MRTLLLGTAPSAAAVVVNYLDTIWYGQSNELRHISEASSPPAASAGTQVWDITTQAWITPPGNGIRTFLNALTLATGRPCRAVYGGQSGVNISALLKGAGTGYYEALQANIVASGISPAFICWHHGEGDGNTASPVAATYQAALDTLHGSLTSDNGKTKASCPLVCSSLANVTDASFVQPDTSWQIIEDALATINSSYPNIHYSHSNRDAVLDAFGVHWNAASYGRSGGRYARTNQFLLGSVSTRPKWFATAAARVTTTTTDITVVHAMGSDFTPTSGITGFDLSGDNGVNWVTGTGARINATTIRLTHSALGTTARLVRYQFGKNPDVSAPVLDNSALANPLNFTSGNLTAAGAATLPALTYSTSKPTTGSGTSQAATGFTVPGTSQSLLLIIGHTISGGSTGATYSSCSVTVQPSGTVIAATLVAKQDAVGSSTAPGMAIFQAIAPLGTTSADPTFTLAASPFQSGRIHVSTIPFADLSSTTAVGSGVLRTASSLTSTTTLATSAGGCVFCLGADASVTGGNAGAFTGTETYATRNSLIANGGTHAVGDSSNVSVNASSSLTVTFGNSANTTVIGASWR